MWVVIWKSYDVWKITHGFDSEKAAQKHAKDVISRPDREYNTRIEVRWIELPPED